MTHNVRLSAGAHRNHSFDPDREAEQRFAHGAKVKERTRSDTKSNDPELVVQQHREEENGAARTDDRQDIAQKDVRREEYCAQKRGEPLKLQIQLPDCIVESDFECDFEDEPKARSRGGCFGNCGEHQEARLPLIHHNVPCSNPHISTVPSTSPSCTAAEFDDESSLVPLEEIASIESILPKYPKHCKCSQLLKWEKDAFEVDDPKPPVTKEALKELDLQVIQNTIPLRNDLPFEQELSFQRVTGNKGAEKRFQARMFFYCLLLELRTIFHDLQPSCTKCKAHQDRKHPSKRKTNRCYRRALWSRLGCYFQAVRDLLVMLVPDADKDEVTEVIDVDDLTCQVRLGLFDAVKFSFWLHKIITRHCAPMRDDMAREMQVKIAKGAGQVDLPKLVEGMEMLLNLLETMKIDIANHQIRSFKILLIADTVPFLKDCFSKMQQKQQISIKSSRRWYEKVKHEPICNKLSDYDALTYTIAGYVCENKIHELPTTFNYDRERLHSLRNDILDHVHITICVQVFVAIRKSLGLSLTAEQANIIHDHIVQIICDEESMSEGVMKHIEKIGVLVAKAANEDVNLICEQTPRKSTSIRLLNYEIMLKYLRQRLEQNESKEMKLVLEQLRTLSTVHGQTYLKLETLQISNRQRARNMTNTQKSILASRTIVDDLSHRLAHITVIHWQVWSDLAYLHPEHSTTANETRIKSEDVPGH